MASDTSDTSTKLPLVAGRWAVDHDHSTLGFAVRHLGISKVRGQFTGFDGEIVVGETLATTTVTATVDVSTVETGNADRDAHLLSDDLLDLALRPTMTFRSTAVRPAAGDDDQLWHLDGDLTIGGITRPLTLAVALGGIEDHPAGGPRHAGFEATAELRRSDYGIGPHYPPPMLGDVVKIQIDLQLLEPDLVTEPG